MAELRLLAQRSELGYTSSRAEALPGEPEAVPFEYQRELTAEAARRAGARRRQEWSGSRDRMRNELELLRGLLGSRYSSDLRVVERVLDRIDRQVT